MNETQYSFFSRVLHWLMAGVFLYQIALGYLMQRADKPFKFILYGRHKTLGLILLMLVVVRLINRLLTTVPSLANFPLWQKRAAKITHYSIYVMMVAIPLSGWLMSSYAGYHPRLPLLGVVALPVDESKSLADVLNKVHFLLNYGLLTLLLLHIAAVIYHSFVLKDKVLGRMAFFQGKGNKV
ncbi:MAG TPA: cytochrome b [Gammaproteobacteria bacterium]|nr:cytochrome b [Gammaproteobacteria bacterium]